MAVGEAFGIPAGENVMDRMVTALKLIGADEVYDTNFAADFTTITEGNEFLERLKNGGPFPMFTSCCPAWVKYLDHQAMFKRAEKNPIVVKMLEDMGEEKAHELLHVSYVKD